MKKILLIPCFAAALLSCEKKNNHDGALKPDFDSTAVAQDSIVSEEPILTQCFAGNKGKDSLFLSYEDNLGTISGEISYKNAEKDSSHGDLSGLLDGDTLKVTYTFQSEGKTTDREIWFLKKGNELIEGTATYDASGETYANTKNVKFSNGYALKNTDCKAISKNLK